MTTTWSQICSISAMRWLEMKTVIPSSASDRMRPRISTMPAGSSPLLGSSRMSSSGAASSAAAIPSRCFMPSEYAP